MIFISKYIVPEGFNGITIFPFISLIDKNLKHDLILIHDEKIHLQQQKEMFIIFFYLFYGLEWFIKLLKYKTKHSAYVNIRFERETYQNENNINYLKTRKTWAFLNYL
ncbi:hypothetical protein LPB03_15660 [Polaribacter vadi]|uniref:Uncharacterized protein n=1 Tax=Polaribacter vadi TaxID=1774273 RepID=A0A1B8TQ95_9FLAO|nr:hypothetical protein [Polaribacter vadi]AOW18799.1 hypothetical protein LPB03_15660 [Polaribacter vadi]OBY61836.1 hypothetical protein LPB3_13645 [Polaribacter vadi]